MSAVTMKQNVPALCERKRSRFQRACSKIKIALCWRKMSKDETAKPALTAAAIALHGMDSEKSVFFIQDSKLVKDAASASTEFGSENDSSLLSPSTIATDTTPNPRSSLRSLKSMCPSIGNKSVRFSVNLEDIMTIATRQEIREETERSKKEAMAAATKRRAAYAKHNGLNKAKDSMTFGPASTRSRLSTARDSINFSLAATFF